MLLLFAKNKSRTRESRLTPLPQLSLASHSSDVGKFPNGNQKFSEVPRRIDLQDKVMEAHSKQPQSKRLRYGRWSESGRVYLITTTTVGRQPKFQDFQAAQTTIRSFHNAPLWDDSKLHAWVLMPDHWHGLVEIGDNQNLSSTIRRFKTITSRTWNQHRGHKDRLWQPGFHDHALRRDEDLVDAARYIVMNPVRAGLVSRVGDYPFWNAIWL